MTVVAPSSFVRPRFTPLPARDGLSADLGEITSLSDLVEFNAQHNPNHTFCIQTQVARNGQDSASSYQDIRISYAQLSRAIRSCAKWLETTSLRDSEDHNTPIALYLESDVGLFIHLVALQNLDIPVLLISARLSPANVEHLLKETGAKTVLASKRTANVLNGHIDAAFAIATVETFTTFINDKNSSTEESNVNGHKSGPQKSEKDTTEQSLILHSSGTTGFPKPIRLTKRYLVGYAACHQFSEKEDIDWINFSTLPLYHGFGFLAPGLSLSLGMTCCFPPSSIIPAGQSTYDLIQTFNCRSLMTVPSIVDDLLAIEGALKELSSLEFLAVGGGALKIDQGLQLKAGNVNLLNHYGVTEIGAIAPIFRPKDDYNWRYLRLRSDLNLELQPIEDSPRFKLVGYPLGWDRHFEVQDELEKNPDSLPQHTEIRILGRTDDVIVLKTGEKIMPQHLENALNSDGAIKTAVCIGQGSFEPAVLIEPARYETTSSGEIDPAWQGRLEDHVWELIQAKNESLDGHARVSSKKAIIVKPMGKPIPRTDKGSVSRRQVHEIFAEEIDAAYAAMDDDFSNGTGHVQQLEMDNLEANVRDMARSVFAGIEGQDADQDFFERGMDSLQTVRLARLLSIAIRKHSENDNPNAASEKLSAEFIYRHSSISALAAAVKKKMVASSASGDASADEYDRTKEVNDLAAKFAREIDSNTSPPESTQPEPSRTVLMTGATGNLGAHMLSQMSRDPSVRKIVCLYRNSARSDRPTAIKAAVTRLHAAMKTADLVVSDEGWQKVELVEDAEFMKVSQHYTKDRHNAGSGYGKDESMFARLAAEVTHIAHLAWPMDFHRTAASFIPHLQMVESLVRLCRLAHVLRGHRARLIFASSIAVVRNYSSKTGTNSVPEAVTDDASVAAPMGYAEAKWICERMLQQVAITCSAEMDPVVVRIGQLSGPESSNGVWKMGEHIPTLVKASRMVGAFPMLDGTMSWLPVDRAGRSLIEMMFCPRQLDSFLHLENPVRQPAADIMTIMAYELGIADNGLMPFEEWQKRAAKLGLIESLSDFFGDHFRALALGSIVLDTTKARAASGTLRGSSALSPDLLVQYLARWREQGLFA